MFKAMDTVTGKDVALKFFDPRHNGDIYRRQCFSREPKLLHEFIGRDNVVQLIEGERLFNVPVVSTAGVPLPFTMSYFVTELAPGSLKDYIYSKQNNPRDSLLLFREVCKGIQRIHANSIFHRDLKPDNCLIFPGKIMKLCDFGTARGFADAPLEPRYDAPVGDTRYMALELFCGFGNEPANYFAADLFSLGTILFELFTRQVLTPLFYEPTILNHLSIVFASYATDLERREQFHNFLPTVISKWSLPDLSSIPNLAPSCIAARVNSFYKQLSDLDYRKRKAIPFTSVFREIDICLKILDHETAYRRWVERRRMRLGVNFNKEPL
jgi:serine/threonine protein kinase